VVFILQRVETNMYENQSIAVYCHVMVKNFAFFCVVKCTLLVIQLLVMELLILGQWSITLMVAVFFPGSCQGSRVTSIVENALFCWMPVPFRYYSLCGKWNNATYPAFSSFESGCLRARCIVVNIRGERFVSMDFTSSVCVENILQVVFGYRSTLSSSTSCTFSSRWSALLFASPSKLKTGKYSW